jgi:hypothetical protein
MLYLLTFASGCMMTFWGLRYTFKIYLKSANERTKGLESKLEKRKQNLIEQQKELQIQREAIQELIWQINHAGTRPHCVTILGLCNLYWLQIESGEYNNAEMNKYVSMIAKTTEELLEQTKQISKQSEHLQ